MSNSLDSEITYTANLWIRFLRKEYEERWWDALASILERSSQLSMNRNIAHKAGFVWIAVYDLASAVKHKQLLNVNQLVPVLLKTIAKEESMREEDVGNTLAELTDGQAPHQIFNYVYKSLDRGYTVVPETSTDTINGFELLADHMFESSHLGDLMTSGRQ